MNILHKYTRQSLFKNKTRTIVTIIGIILSCAMFTATMESLISAQGYMINYVEKTDGSYHLIGSDLTEKEASELQKDNLVKYVSKTENLGFCEMDQDDCPYPYLALFGIEKNITDFVPLTLSRGRLPESTDEIVLSEKYFDFTEQLSNDIELEKDTVTLSLGSRNLDGEKLSAAADYHYGETVTNQTEKTFKIVGIASEAPVPTNGYAISAYTANTGKAESQNLYLKLTSISMARSFRSESSLTKKLNVNGTLATYSGFIKEPSIAILIYGFGAALILLITLGSVALIYNSFSISISERTKQFGLLKSIGATKKQCLSCVLYEAFLLCLIAVPLGLFFGCFGIGVTFSLLQDTFNSAFSTFNIGGLEMKLVIKPMALLASALISVITALISAYIPAKRANKLSPIASIRMTKDVNLKSKAVRTSRLTYRLFGFPGTIAKKNFKRSRKRYRATVISLFMSIVLFISSTLLCSYFTESIGIGLNVMPYDIHSQIYYRENDNEMAEITNKLAKSLSSAKYIDEFVCQKTYMSPLMAVNSDYLTKEYREFFGEEENKPVNIYEMPLIFVDDEVFNSYLEEKGISAPENKINAVLFNSVKLRQTTDNKTVLRSIDIFDLNKTGNTLNLAFGSNETDEAFFSGEIRHINNKDYLVYHEFDTADEVLMDFDDVTNKADINIVLSDEKETPLFLGFERNGMILPISALKQMYGKFAKNISLIINYFFKAENHVAATEEIKEIFKNCKIDKYGYNVYDSAQSEASDRALATIIRVFSIGFIVLISLIAAANVFNTISTNVRLRRREFAVLKSVGMGNKDFNRMMRFESLLYGIKSLALGIPVSLLISVAFNMIVLKSGDIDSVIKIPWLAILIAVFSVFAVVFSTMVYSVSKIKKENTVEALRNENI